MKRAVISFADRSGAGGAGTVISALVLKARLTAPWLGCIGLMVAGASVLRLA